jgi:L-iditol 2-dehydrogenase
VIVKELDIHGEISQIPYGWRTAIHRAANGRVRAEEWVTHVYPLEE